MAGNFRISILGGQGFRLIQEPIDFIESVSQAVNKLVIKRAAHELLKNKIDMLAVDPLLLAVSKSI
jgi:hypothetical protein